MAIPESSPLSQSSFSPFKARRGGEGEEGARVLTLTQGRQARGPAEASRLSSSCSCSTISTLSSPPFDSRQQRSSSSSSSTSGCSRSESRGGGDKDVVGRGFPEGGRGDGQKVELEWGEHAKHCANKENAGADGVRWDGDSETFKARLEKLNVVAVQLEF